MIGMSDTQKLFKPHWIKRFKEDIVTDYLDAVNHDSSVPVTTLDWNKVVYSGLNVLCGNKLQPLETYDFMAKLTEVTAKPDTTSTSDHIDLIKKLQQNQNFTTMKISEQETFLKSDKLNYNKRPITEDERVSLLNFFVVNVRKKAEETDLFSI